MPSLTLRVNGRSIAVDVSPDTPLLWVLRDELGLTGPGSAVQWVRAVRVPCTWRASRFAPVPFQPPRWEIAPS